MNTDKLSGIVVYTIQDDELRDEFRNALLSIGAEPLDQSTYSIPIQGEMDATNMLNSICNTAQKNSKTTFGEKDFVTLYRPTYFEYTERHRYIKQMRIIPFS